MGRLVSTSSAVDNSSGAVPPANASCISKASCRRVPASPRRLFVTPSSYRGPSTAKWPAARWIVLIAYSMLPTGALAFCREPNCNRKNPTVKNSCITEGLQGVLSRWHQMCTSVHVHEAHGGALWNDMHMQPGQAVTDSGEAHDDKSLHLQFWALQAKDNKCYTLCR